MFFKFVLAFFVVCSFLAEVRLKRKTYDGHAVFRLFPNNTQAKMLMEDFESSPYTDIWRRSTGQGDPLDVMFSPNFIPRIISYLKQTKVPYTVLNENVARDLDREVIESRFGFPINYGAVVFNRYMRYEEIKRYLKKLEKVYPHLVKITVIGKSYEGRDIFLVKINAKPKRQPIILIDAGIHAREWITVSMALYIIHQLTCHWIQNAHMLKGLEWHIVPTLNPDGYEYSHTHDRLWRKTRSPILGSHCAGVDGNRNFDFHWNEGGGNFNGPCKENYAGPTPFSESETRALRDHALSMNGYVKVYLTLHSYGNMILHPWGYTKAVPQNGYELTKLGLKASNISVKNGGPAYRVGGSAIMLYIAAGGSDDWMLGRANVPMAYTIELTNHPKGFLLPPSEILSNVKTFFKALEAFAQYATDKW